MTHDLSPLHIPDDEGMRDASTWPHMPHTLHVHNR